MASHVLLDETMEPPMTDPFPVVREEDPRDARPSALAIVEELSARAMKYRELCRARIEELEEDIAKLKMEQTHWRGEHDTITAFLVKDQLSGPISGPMDDDIPMASRLRREMGGH